jgi:hypothetical protein
MYLFIRYAESVGAAHIYTSAKLNKGLDETFMELATRKIECLERERERLMIKHHMFVSFIVNISLTSSSFMYITNHIIHAYIY